MGRRENADRPSSWNVRQVRVLIVITLGAVALGAVEVSAVAQAQTLGSSAGLFIAMMAIGGSVASFLYGGLSLPGSLPVHPALSMVVYCALFLTLTITPGLSVILVLLVLIGAATGPADGIEAMLIGQYTPPEGCRMSLFGLPLSIVDSEWYLPLFDAGLPRVVA